MTGFVDPMLLRELRDIHTPEPAFLWPPAPGWWILGGVLLVIIIGLSWAWYRRGRLRRTARKELREIRRRFQASAETGRLALELSMLLRRVALVRFPRQEVAGLHGEQWLHFLDRHGGDGEFSKGAGRLLAEAPFVPATTRNGGSHGHSLHSQGAPLLQLATSWLDRNT